MRALVVLLAACDAAPVGLGPGLRADGDAIALDPASVPTLACPAGATVERRSDGFACASLAPSGAALAELAGLEAALSDATERLQGLEAALVAAEADLARVLARAEERRARRRAQPWSIAAVACARDPRGGGRTGLFAADGRVRGAARAIDAHVYCPVGRRGPVAWDAVALAYDDPAIDRRQDVRTALRYQRGLTGAELRALSSGRRSIAGPGEDQRPVGFGNLETAALFFDLAIYHDGATPTPAAMHGTRAFVRSIASPPELREIGGVLRVEAGGAYDADLVDALGRRWQADPMLIRPGTPIGRDQRHEPVLSVDLGAIADRTLPTLMLGTLRRSDEARLSYAMSVPNGAYRVALYFAEVCAECRGLTDRGRLVEPHRFTITIEDNAIAAFDPADAAIPPGDDGVGALRVGVAIERVVSVEDGQLDFELLREAGELAIAGFQIVREAP